MTIQVDNKKEGYRFTDEEALTQDNSVDKKLKEALLLSIKANYQFSEDAFDYIRRIANVEDPRDIVAKTIEKLNTLSEKRFFITQRDLEEVKNLKEETKIKTVKKAFRPPAKEIEADVKVFEDPSGRLGSEGDFKSFLSYFQDRFTQLKELIKQRLDVRNVVSIKDAVESPPNTKLNIIGMVTEKVEHKRTIFLQIEDLESVANVIVPASTEENVFKNAQELLLDQVICVCATKGQTDLLIANDIIWPDIPQRKTRKADTSVNVAFISDLHVGSRELLKDALSRFILWLNGKTGNHKQRSLASRIKYVLIAGDLVDGIGVYPEQEKDLEITDIYEQYRVVAQYLEQIPEYINIIIIPGNHDATRQALPQPAITKTYARQIYGLNNVTMLGNPSRIVLHGVEILMYHGRSLDDIITTVPGISYQQLSSSINRAMKILIKTRHLAPIYGNKTPIAPEVKDYLTINSVPDIFHMGHVHVIGCENYRGTFLINSGAWQGQTAFQRKMGLVPQPGIVPVINLKTLHLTTIDFNL